MNTPICDFVSLYNKKQGSRFHMPGHKGTDFLGVEHLDITEISGADSLYEADSIIAESEKNASELFGTQRTVYSVEGSSQCIKAMLYLAVTYRHNNDVRPLIVAARNVHKSFVFAAAELDFDVLWLPAENQEYSLCRCEISPKALEKTLASLTVMPAAVYVTSPDYLGGMQNISAIAEIAHAYRVPLLVDNAHGAYLKFLPAPCHPIDLGADMCCDSAHKTLPVLTGGAYLHFSKDAHIDFSENAKSAMALFGSTSPSYLILQSLDCANKYIDGNYREELASAIKNVDAAKQFLNDNGWITENSDPLKICINAAKCGYSGTELASILRQNNIECEYADPEFTVFMATPQNKSSDFEKLKAVFGKTKIKNISGEIPQSFSLPEKTLTIRDAVFSESEIIAIEKSEGRIAAMPTVSCPPAVPIVISGEKINSAAISIMRHYNFTEIRVVK